MITVRTSLLSLVILAVLLSVALPRLQAEDLDACQRRVAQLTQNMNSTRQWRNTDATAGRQTTSVVS